MRVDLSVSCIWYSLYINYFIECKVVGNENDTRDDGKENTQFPQFLYIFLKIEGERD